MFRKLLLFFSIFSLFLLYSSTYSAWVQENKLVSWWASLQAKIKDLQKTDVWNLQFSPTRVSTNLIDLWILFKNGSLSSKTKDDFVTAILNNSLYISIGWVLKQTYFWYKIVDWVKVLSLDHDFLLQIQKCSSLWYYLDSSSNQVTCTSWNYLDPTRTDLEAEQIILTLQTNLSFLKSPILTSDYQSHAKSQIYNGYSVLTVWDSNWWSMNSVFEQTCKDSKLKDKVLCLEGEDRSLTVYWLRENTIKSATNAQEYQDLISKYTIAWKTQLPNALKDKLWASCPITTAHTISRFIETWNLDQCWLISQDINCDSTPEWIDQDDLNKTTTIYSVNKNIVWGTTLFDIKVILYLKDKQIVKFYKNSNWCFSNILAKDLIDQTWYKVISQGFSNWLDPDSAYNTPISTSYTVDGLTVTTPSNLLTSKSQLVSWYHFYNSKPIFLDNITKRNYKIDLDVTDTTWTGTSKVLWWLYLSPTLIPSDKTLEVDLNQKDLGFKSWTWVINLWSSENWITNSKWSHYTITTENAISKLEYNGKELYNLDLSNTLLNLKNWATLLTSTWLTEFTSSWMELQNRILLSNQYLSWSSYQKSYSDLTVSKKDAWKLYFYRLNQNGWVTNFFLGQIINVGGQTYNLLWKWLSTDATCQSFVKKDNYFFDNNQTLFNYDSTAKSYVWYNPWNWCDFSSLTITNYVDTTWKLSYLKKEKISWFYDSSLELFNFHKSVENTLQWIDFWVALDPTLKSCTMNQVINNQLSTCSALLPLDVDWDWWDEWILSKVWEIELYNNIITQNSLWEYTPAFKLILKSNWDSYCTTQTEIIPYYSVRSNDLTNTCKLGSAVDSDIATGWGTKNSCIVSSSIILNSIDNYQVIYWITWTDKDTKKYVRTQILNNWWLTCN